MKSAVGGGRGVPKKQTKGTKQNQLISVCDKRRGGKTRGQWPYRPAATRAMRNRIVVLYDLN